MVSAGTFHTCCLVESNRAQCVCAQQNTTKKKKIANTIDRENEG